jgi:hypothetical protein
MTTRFAFLDDIEDTLWEATQQTITESLERGESPDHGDLGDEACAWCGHDWHGLRCQPYWIPELGTCNCDDSRQPLDDTWRPSVTRVQTLMRDEGLDGYAATESAYGSRRRLRIDLSAGTFLFGQAARAAAAVAMSYHRSTVQTTAALDALPADLVAAARAFAESERATAPPAPTETDPRRRALTHRQQLGTGPAQPAAGRARRPRTHR